MGKVITIDSIEKKLEEINVSLETARLVSQDILSETAQVTHQSRISNMYKAHENDFIIDANIFENDELD